MQNTPQPDVNAQPNQDTLASSSQNMPPPENPTTPTTPITPIPPSLPPNGEQPPKRSKKKPIIIVALAFLIALGIGGYLDTKQNNNTSAPAVTKKDVPLLRVEYSVSEVPQYPLKDDGYGSDGNVILQLFEGLVQYKNQTQIVPMLATDWSNPDSSTWVFNLRHDVKFHSGRLMTAADVKYTLDYAVAHQNDDRVSSLASANTIKQVDVTGPYQVKITTAAPDPLLLAKLTLLDVVDSKAKLGDYNAGTGPYLLKPGTTPTDTTIDLIASDNYWAGHVYTREVDIKFVADQDQVLKDLKANKFDLSGPFTTTDLAQYNLPKQTMKVTQQGMSFLMLNTERAGSPLQSLAARQAIAYSLNVPELLKEDGLKGVQASQLVPEELPGHNPAINNAPYDAAKAKQLLASVKNASQTLTFAYTPRSEVFALHRVKQLEDAGFNIKPISVDSNSLATDAFGGKYDIVNLAYASNYIDGLDILSTLLTDNKNYDNAQIDALIDQTSNTFEQNNRIKLMQQVATIVDAEKPIIPVYTEDDTFVMTNTKLVAVPDMPSFDNSVYYWKVYQQ